MSETPSLAPVHVPPDGGDTVGTAPARMLFMYSPAGMEGMFAEIGAPGTRGVQGPPRSAADVEALIAIAAKYRFTIGG